MPYHGLGQLNTFLPAPQGMVFQWKGEIDRGLTDIFSAESGQTVADNVAHAIDRASGGVLRTQATDLATGLHVDPYLDIRVTLLHGLASINDVIGLVELGITHAGYQWLPSTVGYWIVYNPTPAEFPKLGPEDVGPATGTYQGSPTEQAAVAAAGGQAAVDLANRQAYCEKLSLVYNEETGQCECGWLDQFLVDAGLKEKCQDQLFSTTTGIVIGAGVVLVGIVVLNRVLK